MINHHEENKDEINPDEIEKIEKSLFSDSYHETESIGLMDKPVKPKKSAEPQDESIGLKPSEDDEQTSYEKIEESLFCNLDDKPDEELTYRQLTFSFNKVTAERLVIGTAILVLLFFFFYNPFHNSFPWNQPGYGQATALMIDEDEIAQPEAIQTEDNYIETTADPLAAVEEESEEAAAAEGPTEETVEASAENETPAEETEQPASTPTTITAGTVSLEIGDIETKMTNYGGKVTLVSFKITNKKRNFVPKIKAYVYDEENKDERMYSPNIHTYEELEVGKIMRANIETQNALFNDLTTEKTVLLRLYDEGDKPNSKGDILITTAEKTVMIK